MLMDEVRGELVLKKLPPQIRNSFTPEQVSALRHATGQVRPRRHPVDARFSFRLPLLGQTYLVFLLGRELRSSERRASDHRLRAVDRISHVVLLLLGASTFLLAALIGILFQNAILSN